MGVSIVVISVSVLADESSAAVALTQQGNRDNPLKQHYRALVIFTSCLLCVREKGGGRRNESRVSTTGMKISIIFWFILGKQAERQTNGLTSSQQQRDGRNGVYAETFTRRCMEDTCTQLAHSFMHVKPTHTP